MNQQQLIYAKTNIGGWFFDAVIRTDHVSKLTITEHPIQTGAAIADHAFVMPAELTIQIGMSDVAQGIVSGQFSQGPTRSITAYNVLLELQKNRIPIQVLTRLGLYKNMLIESISAPDDYKTMYGLNATVTMREIIVATVKTVKISARPQVTGSTNKGNQEPVKTDKSIYKQAKDMFLGKKSTGI